MSKNFVLDTNVLLTDPHCITTGFDENNLLLPLMVIEELDHIKKESSNRGFCAREVFRIINDLLLKEEVVNIREGIVRNEEGGVLKIVSVTNECITNLNDFNFSLETKDDIIVLTALKVFKDTDGNAVFVSNDTNARLKAIIHDIPTEMYKNSAVPREIVEYNGYRTVFMPLAFFGDIIDGKFLKSKDERDFLSLEELDLEEGSVYPNEFILLEVDPNSSSYELVEKRVLKKLKCVYRFNGDELTKKTLNYTNLYGGITGRNLEQSCALDILLDDDVKVVTVKSPAGSGKTFISLSSALTKLFEKNSSYEKVILIKPTVSVSDELGYLPGDANSKLQPFMKSFFDNLDMLRKRHTVNKGESFVSIEDMMSDGVIEMEAISYIRGRSFNDCIIICDELQNVDKGTVKTILSRVGQNCKLIALGDVEQIDESYLSKHNNGLAHLIRNFCGQPFYGHITLNKCERSIVAEASAKLL